VEARVCRKPSGLSSAIEATAEEANVFDMPFADRFKALDDAAQEPIAAQPDATGNEPCRYDRVM
jgi:hypothetical protein